MPLANGSTGPSQRGTIVRILLALVVVAVVVVAGVYFVKHGNASANPQQPSTQAASPTPLPPPEALACGEGDALLSALRRMVQQNESARHFGERVATAD